MGGWVRIKTGDWGWEQWLFLVAWSQLVIVNLCLLIDMDEVAQLSKYLLENQAHICEKKKSRGMTSQACSELVQ